ncbi:MAG: ribosome maturation factor RimP [Candidatus Dormibacteraeota bacterium]|nr:ribosome maturation factor RimP [Candidatus Dormibacteraeota bacterium]
MNTDTSSQIAELLRPSLTHLGIDLIDVRWSGRGHGAVLRVVIDRDGGVTLGDCERASNAASAVLDAYDPIDSSYRLEVSSPGAERPLRAADDWRSALGRRINARLRSGDGERVVEGTLLGVSIDLSSSDLSGSADLEVRDRRRTRTETIPLDDVIAARIVVAI